MGNVKERIEGSECSEAVSTDGNRKMFIGLLDSGHLSNSHLAFAY